MDKEIKKIGVSLFGCEIFISETDKIIFEDKIGKQYEMKEIKAPSDKIKIEFEIDDELELSRVTATLSNLFCCSFSDHAKITMPPKKYSDAPIYRPQRRDY